MVVKTLASTRLFDPRDLLLIAGFCDNFRLVVHVASRRVRRTETDAGGWIRRGALSPAMGEARAALFDLIGAFSNA
jgi:hypothetical protein